MLSKEDIKEYLDDLFVPDYDTAVGDQFKVFVGIAMVFAALLPFHTYFRVLVGVISFILIADGFVLADKRAKHFLAIIILVCPDVVAGTVMGYGLFSEIWTLANSDPLFLKLLDSLKLLGLSVLAWLLTVIALGIVMALILLIALVDHFS